MESVVVCAVGGAVFPGPRCVVACAFVLSWQQQGGNVFMATEHRCCCYVVAKTMQSFVDLALAPCSVCHLAAFLVKVAELKCLTGSYP